MTDVDRCAECGYVYDTPRERIPNELRRMAARYRSLLHGDADRLRAHTKPGVWSPLEYACHYRDVLRVQLERVRRAVREEKPTFAPMRRDERVTEERYNEQEPEHVAFDIAAAAGALASALDHLSPKSWEREGLYNYPTQQLRSIEWIARNTIHEGVHHILDIERLLGLRRA